MYEVTRYTSGKAILCVVREDGEMLGQLIVNDEAAADRLTSRLEEPSSRSEQIPACEGSELPLDTGEYPIASAPGVAA